MIETQPRAPELGAVQNVWLFARGARAVVWTRDESPRVIEPATGRIVLALPPGGARVIDADPAGTCALLTLPREDGGYDLTLWDLGADLRRIGTLERVRPRLWFASIRGARIVTLHGGQHGLESGHRMRFDGQGRLQLDEPIELVARKVISTWVALTPDERTILRATPHGEVFAAADGREVEIAGQLGRVSMAGSLHVRGSLDPAGRRVVVFFRALARVRVLDIAARAIEVGAWDEANARAAFFCGENLVVAESCALRVYVGADTTFAREIEQDTTVARLDDERAVIVGRASIDVLHVARGEVVAHAPLPEGRATRVVAGDGLVCLVDEGAGLTILRVG